jgi:hypothetical protein
VNSRKLVYSFAVGAFLAALLASPTSVSAHEKWFHDAESLPTRWDQLFQLPGAISLGVGLALTGVVALAWRLRQGRDLIPGPQILGATDAGLTRFYAWVPVILGVHVGLPLIILGIRGELFSPNNGLPGPWLY